MKNKVTATVLAFFLGAIGVHKFYLGETGKGILYLLFCWTCIPAIIALIDFIILLTMNEEKFNAKYNAHNNNTATASSEFNDAKYKLNGILGNLYVYDNRIVFDRTSTSSAKVFSGLSGNKTIPMKAIQSVQFKEAGSAFNGFIQFGIMGGVESNGGLLAATSDENSIFFKKTENESAKAIKSFIEEKIYGDAPSQPAPVNIANELLKLNELLEKGVISKEEFELQKTKLLK